MKFNTCLNENYDCFISTPIATMGANASNKGITQLNFIKNLEHTNYQSISDGLSENLPVKVEKYLTQLKQELKEYFSGNRKIFSVPLDIKGSDFQLNVWRQLKKIDYGKLTSYQNIAIAINSSKACRAVGSANGKNPIAIVIPCHRVINKNNNIGGFSYDIKAKEFLINLEKHQAV